MMATVCVKLATLPPAAAKSRYVLAFNGVDIPEIDITKKSGQHVYYRVDSETPHSFQVKFYPMPGVQASEYHPSAVFKVRAAQQKMPICQLVQDAMVTTTI